VNALSLAEAAYTPFIRTLDSELLAALALKAENVALVALIAAVVAAATTVVARANASLGLTDGVNDGLGPDLAATTAARARDSIDAPAGRAGGFALAVAAVAGTAAVTTLGTDSARAIVLDRAKGALHR
jgi:hypothetical protein